MIARIILESILNFPDINPAVDAIILMPLKMLDLNTKIFV